MTANEPDYRVWKKRTGKEGPFPAVNLRKDVAAKADKAERGAPSSSSGGDYSRASCGSKSFRIHKD